MNGASFGAPRSSLRESWPQPRTPSSGASDGAGIFFGMKTYPEAGAVLEGLGEKFVHGLGRAVYLTRTDLTIYRQQHPDWLPRHGERGLANWIQDHLWFHVTAQLDDGDGVVVRDQGVYREVTVSDSYRLRLKRHDPVGNISTYPTQSAIEFLEQPQGQLPGMELIHLIAGYEWDRENREILRGVISLRDRDDVRWVAALPEDDASRAEIIEIPSLDGPKPPSVEVAIGRETENEVQGEE